MRHWLGYLFGGFLVCFAGMVAGLAHISATSTMEAMPRLHMPGREKVTLPPGRSSLYAEGAGDVRVTCTASSGLELRAPAEAVTYSLAGFEGRKVYDVTAQGGTYELACESDGASAFTIAIGAGVGAWRVIAKLAIIPFAIGAVLLAVTFVRRRRMKRQ